jgi:hypothetical protein
MRTSLEIPDPLFKAAKRLALEQNTTLKELVARGLERVVAEAGGGVAPACPDSRRLPKVRPAGEGTYAMSNADVDRLLAEEEGAPYGRPR